MVFKIIAAADAHNYKIGDIVAFKRELTDQWMDPWGGEFDEGEQRDFDDVARGVEKDVVLSDDRLVACTFAIDF